MTRVIKKLKLNYKYWVGTLAVMIVVGLSIIIFTTNDIVKELAVEVTGASIAILVLSILFRKVLI